jgi:hypothetical protein
MDKKEEREREEKYRAFDATVALKRAGLNDVALYHHGP